MKNLLTRGLCACVLLGLSLPGHAVAIGNFPGLDRLIRDADTVAIVRVDDAVVGFGPDGWMTRRCYVYQTLKGNLKQNTTVPLMFNEFVGLKSNVGGQTFAPMTTHLVFLNRSIPSNGATIASCAMTAPICRFRPLATKPNRKAKRSNSKFKPSFVVIVSTATNRSSAKTRFSTKPWLSNGSLVQTQKRFHNRWIEFLT